MLNKSVFTVVIIMYVTLYLIINQIKPDFIFNNLEDNLRQFGIGYKEKTIFPLWLVSIILAIFSYFIVCYVYHLKYNLFIRHPPHI
jgi:hypothetical protein